MMTLSVVIVTRNRAELLSATLGQIAKQRFSTGDEVIVIDNASTDGTADVIRRTAAGFPVPLRPMHSTAPGKTPALNLALAAARGEVLALTDDDVLVADDWLETIRTLFANTSVDLIGGRVDPRWERPAPRWLRVDEDEGDRYGEMASPLALLHYGPAQELGTRTAVGANLIVRKSVYDSLGGFDPRLGRGAGNLLCGEDHDLSQRAVASGFHCEYRPEVRVQHWVPASRTRILYHLRWFFYSGATNAMLDARVDEGATGGPGIPRYFWRQLLTSPAVALGYAITGRFAHAVNALTQAAFALGYIAQRLRDRWNRRRQPRRSHVPSTFGVNG
jgi:glycosyltransferase involved in cell wall biosynthesis